MFITLIQMISDKEATSLMAGFIVNHPMSIELADYFESYLSVYMGEDIRQFFLSEMQKLKSAKQKSIQDLVHVLKEIKQQKS